MTHTDTHMAPCACRTRIRHAWSVRRGQPPPHQLVLAYQPKTKDGDTEDAAECVVAFDASQVEAIFELADAQEAYSSTDSDSDSYNPPDFLCESSSDDSDLPEGSTDELDA